MPRWRNWRAALAAGEDRLDDEAPLFARLLDREPEPFAQHDPALGGKRHGQRIEGALAAVSRQRRQLLAEALGELLAIGGVHLVHLLAGLRRAALQRLDEGPHRQELLVAPGALADGLRDALVERARVRDGGSVHALAGK